MQENVAAAIRFDTLCDMQISEMTDVAGNAGNETFRIDGRGGAGQQRLSALKETRMRTASYPPDGDGDGDGHGFRLAGVRGRIPEARVAPSAWRQHVGRVVHVACARLAVHPGRHDDDALGVVVRDTVVEVVREFPFRGRSRAGLLEVLSGVLLWARDLAPPAEWVFLGAEIPVGTGVLDQAWRTPDGSVVADELKSGCWDPTLCASNVLAQADRHRRNGTAVWDEFAGVRLLSVTRPRNSRWLAAGTPDPLPVPLHSTVWWGRDREGS